MKIVIEPNSAFAVAIDKATFDALDSFDSERIYLTAKFDETREFHPVWPRRIPYEVILSDLKIGSAKPAIDLIPIRASLQQIRGIYQEACEDGEDHFAEAMDTIDTIVRDILKAMK